MRIYLNTTCLTIVFIQSYLFWSQSLFTKVFSCESCSFFSVRSFRRKNEANQTLNLFNCHRARCHHFLKKNLFVECFMIMWLVRSQCIIIFEMNAIIQCPKMVLSFQPFRKKTLNSVDFYRFS